MTPEALLQVPDLDLSRIHLLRSTALALSRG